MIQPLTIPVPQERKVRLMADFQTPWGTVPAWFKFDGASVPPFGWAATYTPFHPVVLGPACWHDWQYLVHTYPRVEVDKQFLVLLMENGANPFKARLMYSAVQTAGRYFWNQNQEDVKYLNHLYQMCRDRDNWKSYGFSDSVPVVDLVKASNE